jgi:hypothetical protein
MTFRFLGFESIIGESQLLRSFGQVADLTASEAVNAILGGCALLDGGTFDQIGFTAAELQKYSAPSSHEFAPAEFLAKKKAALLAAHELRGRLEAGGTILAALAGTVQILAPGETLAAESAATTEVTE